MPKIRKILIANRGEIAVRVIRSCKDMGIATVAVYSEPDVFSPHVQIADESVCIGPASSKESYLRVDKIIEACKEFDVDAIHPGYGFLSENADFAEAVAAAGIKFIGPSPESIRIMGDKLAAKDAVSKYGIPMVPGTDHAVADVEEAKKLASEIGYPILVKASAGGGGKGMRVIRQEAEFLEQMNLAISEATSAFGDGSVFIEKFIESNKHIEVQILGDQHGNIIHLFERECSIQRRHQKVIEEAPSVVISDEIRNKIGETAVKVAKACDYFGAGTVEFIFDQNKDFYFLEMNTRLQVEHPVTELITGMDLVQEQIRIAEGQVLSIKQNDVSIKGHAIEVRVYAEDPRNGFLPDTGTLETYHLPKTTNVRVDDGFAQGMEIPIYYDPMIAKLITWGKDRDEARKNMIKAIDDYIILGVETTLDFGKFVMTHPAFIDGSFNTKFVEKYFTADKLDEYNLDEAQIAAAVASYILEKDKVSKIPVFEDTSNWKHR